MGGRTSRKRRGSLSGNVPTPAETKQFLDREIGANVKHRPLVKAKLDLLQQRLEVEKDPIALIDCLIFCRDNGVYLPRWALKPLADALENYYRGRDSLDEALPFGSKKQRGRHGTRRTASDDRRFRIQFALYCRTLIAQGLKGEAKIDALEKWVGEKHGHRISRETIKRYVSKRHQFLELMDKTERLHLLFEPSGGEEN